jgi:hypothetical protein
MVGLSGLYAERYDEIVLAASLAFLVYSRLLASFGGVVSEYIYKALLLEPLYGEGSGGEGSGCF